MKLSVEHYLIISCLIMGITLYLFGDIVNRTLHGDSPITRYIESTLYHEYHQDNHEEITCRLLHCQ